MEKELDHDQLLFLNKIKVGIINPFSDQFLIRFTKPAHNDIIAFHYPKLNDVTIKSKPVLVKRCIGTPGDLLVLRNKQLFLNKKRIEDSHTLMFKYRIVSDSDLLSSRFINEFGLIQGEKVSDHGIYDFPLTTQLYDELKSDDRVKSIRRLREKDTRSAPVFPANGYYNWNGDFYGPLIVPSKGMTVDLNYRNYGLYSRIIIQYEGNDAYLDIDKIYINGILASTYTFQQDYYFVLDDNRDYSNDSRQWGFLPEDHIIAKIICRN